MLIFGNDAEIALWMGEHLGERFEPPFTTIGIARHGKIVAGVLYNNYRKTNVEMTIASISPLWATRQTLGALFRYPFLQLNVKRCTAITEATNQTARSFLCRLGFVEEGRHPDLFPSGAGVSYGLYRSAAAKWLEESHEQSTIGPAAG